MGKNWANVEKNLVKNVGKNLRKNWSKIWGDRENAHSQLKLYVAI